MRWWWSATARRWHAWRGSRLAEAIARLVSLLGRSDQRCAQRRDEFVIAPDFDRGGVIEAQIALEKLHQDWHALIAQLGQHDRRHRDDVGHVLLRDAAQFEGGQLRGF